MHNWFIFKEFDEAAKAASDFIAHKILLAIKGKDRCNIALPGGSSPKFCFAHLIKKELPWSKVHWYVGDERCCPKNHPERNDLMLEQTLWSKIAQTNTYPIPAELGAEEAAKVYREVISEVNFDIIFLGVGEDGHTASLFPENIALTDTRTVVPVFNSPKPPAERVSLSVNTLKKSHHRIVLANGKEKSLIVKKIKEGANYPVNNIGEINWFINE